jgi:hypothetical protein
MNAFPLLTIDVYWTLTETITNSLSQSFLVSFWLTILVIIGTPIQNHLTEFWTIVVSYIQQLCYNSVLDSFHLPHVSHDLFPLLELGDSRHSAGDEIVFHIVVRRAHLSGTRSEGKQRI